MLAKKYLDKGLELLQRLQDRQLENIEQAAEFIAQAIADGHTLYAWGDWPWSIRYSLTDCLWR